MLWLVNGRCALLRSTKCEWFCAAAGLVVWLAAVAARGVAAAAEVSDSSASGQQGAHRRLAFAAMAVEALASLCGDGSAAGAQPLTAYCMLVASTFSKWTLHAAF